ncbi:MAG: RsmE family RNA methyltransferase [Spirochaetia bacterium]|nr:RsmE family RNA methyltransferase [Spirochaetia bacterium]
MKQFILPPSFAGGSSVLLDEKDTHYLKNVLRVKVGSELNCTAPDGSLWRGIVSSFDGGCTLELFPAGLDAEKEAVSSSSGTRVVLYQSIIKGKNMDLIIRQAVEAGVAAVVPVETEYSQIRLKDFKNEKPERWQRIIKEAMQQSGTSIQTAVETMIKVEDIPPVSPDEVGLFFHQSPMEKKSIHQHLDGKFKKVSLFVGPEGGLSQKDIAVLEAKGFKPVYLGHNILRAETAAIYATAIVNNLILEKETWNAR